DSAAIIVFLAGAKRYCGSNARFNFHQIRTDAKGEWSTEKYHENMESLQSDIMRTKNIYVSRTLMKPEKAESLLSKANLIEAAGALELGLVHAIEPVRIPVEATTHVVASPTRGE